MREARHANTAAVELALLTGRRIGAIPTLVLIAVTGLAGTVLAKRQGWR